MVVVYRHNLRLIRGGGGKCSLEEEELRKMLASLGTSPGEAKKGLSALILSGGLSLSGEDEQRIFGQLRNLEGTK